MKPQLYSIVILLLTRINYGLKNSTQDATVSGTQRPLIPTDNTTSVAKPPDVTSDHKTSAPETPEDVVTSVTTAPKGNTTSVTKTSGETIVSEIPTGKATVLSEASNSQATSAPSLAPNVSLVYTTKGFTVTTRSGGTPKATGSTSTLIGNQTSNPIVAGNATSSTSTLIGNQTSNPIVAGNTTTQRSNKVTNAVRKTTKLTSTKSTTGNRTSALLVPSLFAIVLLVVSVLCF